jgi:hypothetical protein
MLPVAPSKDEFGTRLFPPVLEALAPHLSVDRIVLLIATERLLLEFLQ